jgi:hypothetical protein
MRAIGGEWAKSYMQKANLLAKHFGTVFQPYTSEIPEAEDQQILNALISPGLPYTPVRPNPLDTNSSLVRYCRNYRKPGCEPSPNCTTAYCEPDTILTNGKFHK